LEHRNHLGTLANAVTLVRLLVVCVGAALALRGPAGIEWWLVCGASVELALDGLDGPIARARGETSAFGARFDGEVDALAMLVLSILVWRTGAAGAWVLAVGGLRYALLAAAALWPRLRGHVPSSLRAKIICDVNLGALIVALAPIGPAWVHAALPAGGLALLAYSFGHDVLYLLRR
jgi:phosphatidylglycerophosphate synthase